MRFSIITICLNDMQGLKTTIESVKMQELKEYEHIIIDGASSDGTRDMVKTLYDNQIKFYSEPDEGISDAFNKGIEKSEGEVLLFLNSGDSFCDSHVLRCVADAFDEYDSDVIFFVAQGQKYTIPKRMDDAAETIWREAAIPHQAAFIKRGVFTRVGVYNKYIKIRMDYDFFLRCVKDKISYTYIPQIIVFYEGNGISEKNNELFEKEGMAIRLLYGEDEKSDDIMQEQLKKVQKFRDMFLCTKNWIILKQKRIKMSECLGLNRKMKIAIYGAGYVGQLLYSELLEDKIPVVYYIDSNKNIIVEKAKVINSEQIDENLDIVIVTTMTDYSVIFQKLSHVPIKKILVLKDELEKFVEQVE